MIKMVWIICFWILVVTDPSLSTRCPISSNDRVNITRSGGGGSTYWIRNNKPLTGAAINASTGTCYSPSDHEEYTTYCEAGRKYTLEVHHPVEGDRYSDINQLNIITTIIFQEPEPIRLVVAPPLNTNITLTDDDTYNLTTTVTCTKPTPVLQWLVRPTSGTDITINGESTTDKTGCDVKQSTITSRTTISKHTVNLFNQPFQVFSQLSYVECDNIHTSKTGRYFTITESAKITKLITDQINNVMDEGADVMFTCSVDSFVPPSIIWTRSQQEGELYYGAQYILRDVTCGHTDNYTCSANNTVDKVVSRSVPLYVRCSPREISPTPRIITNKVGAVVTLQVDIIAYPAPTFTWYYRGTDHRLTTVVTEQLTINQYKSTLTITLNSCVFGDYVVSVVNDVSKVNFTFIVKEGDLIKDTDDRYDAGYDAGVGVGFGIGVGVCLVIVGVIVLIIWIILKRKGRRIVIQSRGDGTRGNTGEDTHYAGLDNINMSTSAPVADHSMNSQDYVNTPSPSMGLAPSTAPTQSSTYDSLDPKTTDEPSKTYEQLKIYQNLK